MFLPLTWVPGARCSCRSLRSYLQLLYAVESSKRTFDIFLQVLEPPPPPGLLPLPFPTAFLSAATHKLTAVRGRLTCVGAAACLASKNKEVPCGLDSLFKVMKHKSKPYTKKFPIHYDAAVEGMEPGKEETARLVFGCVPKEAEDNNWCAAAPCSPAPQARVPSRA